MLYLRRAFFQNQGPIQDLNISIPFTDDGKPKPLIMVGENGSGKTIFLAAVADAILEFQSAVFDDALPRQGVGHQYFKLLGDNSRRIGSDYSTTVLRFREATLDYDYCEKTGNAPQIDAQTLWSDTPLSLNGWNQGSGKHCSRIHLGNKKPLEDAFRTGTFTFFMSNRAEIPHWLNSHSAEIKDRSSFRAKFNTRLDKPLTIVSSMDETLDQISGIALIDEIDAHLHIDLQRDVLPNLIAMFPRVQFLITSHAPLFLFGMERKFGVSGASILHMPDGKALNCRQFSEYEEVIASIDVQDVIRRSVKQTVVLVEGASDEILLKTAWEKRKGGEMPFELVNSYDCYSIQNHYLREQLFVKSPTRTFIGLLDFDAAFECWERVQNTKNGNWSELVQDASNGLTLKHRTHKAYLSLLPIPRFRAEMASREFGRDSCLSIEFLFDDANIAPHVIEKALPGGGRKRKFNDEKKMAFAECASRLNPDQFLNFDPLFALFDLIIANANGQK
jgi:predicted ATPase